MRANRVSRLGCRGLQEKKGKVRYSKKSSLGYISPMCGAAPSQPIATVFGTSCILADAINPAKFHFDQLRGFGREGT